MIWGVTLFLALANPEQRAVEYLSAEVPRWSRENHCFSCHNNGDGARALFAAARRGYPVPPEALADTRGWLTRPGEWDRNPGNPGFSSPKLANIQFAAALAEDRSADARTILSAAESLLKFQEPDGSWGVDTRGMPGAPATYGIALGTYLARRTLEIADPRKFASAIARANRWFETTEPGNLPDAAAMLLALPKSQAVRAKCLPMILKSQNPDGGWGPQLHMPSETFDTALALLTSPPENARVKGRQFLLAQQLPSGGWMETTRPSGGQSYAEHISTTAWALFALLATDAKRQ